MWPRLSHQDWWQGPRAALWRHPGKSIRDRISVSLGVQWWSWGAEMLPVRELVAVTETAPISAADPSDSLSSPWSLFLFFLSPYLSICLYPSPERLSPSTSCHRKANASPGSGLKLLIAKVKRAVWVRRGGAGSDTSGWHSVIYAGKHAIWRPDATGH